MRDRVAWLVLFGAGCSPGVDYGLSVDKLLGLPPQKPFVLLLHGTTWDTKHWPEAYWRELAERMGHLGVDVKLPWGNAIEKARAERLARLIQIWDRIPPLSETIEKIDAVTTGQYL